MTTAKFKEEIKAADTLEEMVVNAFIEVLRTVLPTLKLVDTQKNLRTESSGIITVRGIVLGDSIKALFLNRNNTLSCGHWNKDDGLFTSQDFVSYPYDDKKLVEFFREENGLLDSDLIMTMLVTLKEIFETAMAKNEKRHEKLKEILEKLKR